MCGLVGLPPLFVQLVLSGLTVFGAIRMLTLSGRGWAKAAAVLAMIPCSPGFVPGLAVGIWALAVLAKPDVRRAFENGRMRR